MATDDFFRARLDQMIDLRHPPAVLAGRMPWAQIEAEATLAPAFARKNRRGQVMAGSDLFGTALEIAGVGMSAAGPPRLPIRLIVEFCRVDYVLSRTASWKPRSRRPFSMVSPLS